MERGPVEFGLAVFLVRSPRGLQAHVEGEFGEVQLKLQLLGEATVSHAEYQGGGLSHALCECVAGPQWFRCSLIIHRLEERWWLFKAGEGDG